MKHIVLLCSLALIGYAQAHSSDMITKPTFTSVESCPKHQTLLLGKMTLSAGTFKYLESEGTNICGSTRQDINRQPTPHLDCGQFDDWRLAYDMGTKMCEALLGKMKGFNNKLYPEMSVFTRFEGPFEFKGDEHHQKYEANMGVTLSCYLCENTLQISK